MADISPTSQNDKMVEFWNGLPPYARSVARFVSVASLLGFAGWLLQNFLQLRSVVDLLASRIDLGFLWLSCSMIGWILTASVHRRTTWRIAIVASFLAVLGFDAWAPKPNTAQKSPAPLPAAPSDKSVIADADIDTTATDVTDRNNKASATVTVTSLPCTASLPMKAPESIAPSQARQAKGIRYGERLTLLKQKRRLVRFRIRSSAPIQDLDLEGNANLEVAQKYQDLGVIDIREVNPTTEEINLRPFSNEEFESGVCFERLN
jgi:hypothetical protein